MDFGRDPAQYLALDIVRERERAGFERVRRLLAVDDVGQDRYFLMQPAGFILALLGKLADEAGQRAAVLLAQCEAPAARSWLRIA